MLLVILLLAFGVRLININQSLWLDEAITALAVKNNTLGEIITKFAPGDFHPPLYYLVLKLWTNLFGYSEVALRLPSVFFGVLTVVFIYKIGERLFNKKIGLVAALFLAINPLAVYYSQEARMYSLAMLAVTGATYFFLINKKLLFWLFLVTALYTDYLPFFMVPVFWLLEYQKAGKLRPPILNTLFLILAFLPWLPIFFSQLTQGAVAAGTVWGDILGRLTVKNLFLFPVKFIFGRISLDNKLLYGVVVTVVGSIYLFILTKARNKILWFWLLLPIIFGAVISVKIPLLTYFRFLFVLPAFVLLLAAGCGQRKLLMGFIGLMGLMSLMIFNLNSRFWREDWRSATEFVRQENAAAVLPSLAQAAPLQHYAPGLTIMDRNTFRPGAEKIIYFRYVAEIFDPKGETVNKITAGGYQPEEEKNFGGISAIIYNR